MGFLEKLKLNKVKEEEDIIKTLSGSKSAYTRLNPMMESKIKVIKNVICFMIKINRLPCVPLRRHRNRRTRGVQG